MQPSRDLDVLKRRLDAVSYFVNPRNAEVTSSFQDALKQIKNVPVSKDHKVTISLPDKTEHVKTFKFKHMFFSRFVLTACVVCNGLLSIMHI